MYLHVLQTNVQSHPASQSHEKSACQYSLADVLREKYAVTAVEPPPRPQRADPPGCRRRCPGGWLKVGRVTFSAGEKPEENMQTKYCSSRPALVGYSLGSV